MYPHQRLIIFAKWPMPGAVKTRLAAAIGGKAATELAQAFLLDLVEIAGQVAAELVLAYAPASSRDLFQDLLPSPWQLWEQAGNDLGDRLTAALDRSSDANTVVIGTDSPWLSPQALNQAFAALTAADAVAGPCADGGFYLLGLESRAAGQRWEAGHLLQHIRWSTKYALEDLLGRMRQSGLECRLLAPGYDVDTADDLARLADELRHLPGDALPATRRVLAHLVLGEAEE